MIMAGGVVIEFSHFGDFDSFDIIRSTTPINPSAPPEPIATGLTSMAYIDRTVVIGETYYYRAAVWRGLERLISAVDVKVLALDNADLYWENVVCLLSIENGVITDHAPLAIPRTWNNVSNGIKPSSDSYLSEQSMSFAGTGWLSTATDMNLGTGDYTFEAFIKPEVTPGLASMLSFYGSSYYVLAVRPSPSPINLGLLVFDGSEVGRGFADTSMAGRWVHVAITRQGGAYKMFIDGALVRSASGPAATNLSGRNILIGTSDTGGSDKFRGLIEQIRVTKGIVRYTASFTPPIQRFPDYQ